jgi:RNA polymerase sigma-70 factor (ECF subfamily)
LVRYLVRGDHDVDDLSQDALLLILEGIHTYRGDGPFRSWADRVVARSVFAARRSSSRRAEQPVDEDELAAASSALPDRYYLLRQLAERLDALPLAQRDALVLHCVVGLRVAEVAAELGVPEETVRSRIRLGKDRLRQQLSDPSPTEGELGSDDDAIGNR